MKKDAKIILLHHSTGNCVWEGGVPAWFEDYNAKNGTAYSIVEQAFPKKEPYGWRNYPYDYWNIWVKNAGDQPYEDEKTLEMLTKEYDVIVFKHCFPVSAVQEDTGAGDINSDVKSAENYKLQYAALKTKLREFPDTKFIVWTGAALPVEKTDEAQAKRARAFFAWAKEEWDEKGDNIYLWDFDQLQTEGETYMKPEYRRAEGDAHPSPEFCKTVAPKLGQRIVDVIEGRGDEAALTGA
jgi:hypothetical protein